MAAGPVPLVRESMLRVKEECSIFSHCLLIVALLLVFILAVDEKVLGVNKMSWCLIGI